MIDQSILAWAVPGSVEATVKDIDPNNDEQRKAAFARMAEDDEGDLSDDERTSLNTILRHHKDGQIDSDSIKSDIEREKRYMNNELQAARESKYDFIKESHSSGAKRASRRMKIYSLALRKIQQQGDKR